MLHLQSRDSNVEVPAVIEQDAASAMRSFAGIEPESVACVISALFNIQRESLPRSFAENFDFRFLAFIVDSQSPVHVAHLLNLLLADHRDDITRLHTGPLRCASFCHFPHENS